MLLPEDVVLFMETVPFMDVLVSKVVIMVMEIVHSMVVLASQMVVHLKPPDSKDPVANLDAKFLRIHSSTAATSEASEDYVPQVPNPTPPSDWLLPGETDETVFKIKHLKGVQITRLPNDATSCRKWRAAFLAAVSRIDLTDRDVPVKFCVHCVDGGRGRRFREDLQASSAFSMFNKHVAAELIKPEVLATNADLAQTSWVEECATKREGPKGMPLMNPHHQLL